MFNVNTHKPQTRPRYSYIQIKQKQQQQLYTRFP